MDRWIEGMWLLLALFSVTFAWTPSRKEERIPLELRIVNEGLGATLTQLLTYSCTYSVSDLIYLFNHSHSLF